jgi:hypothetical protein
MKNQFIVHWIDVRRIFDMADKEKFIDEDLLKTLMNLLYQCEKDQVDALQRLHPSLVNKLEIEMKSYDKYRDFDI